MDELPEVPPQKYPAASILLHWLTAIVIFATIPLGMSLERAPPAWMDTLYRLHWSFGLTALALTAVRIANRASAAMPAPYAGLTRIERALSTAIHHLLYGLLVIVPILGWAGKSAYGGAITVFGLFDVPAIVTQDQKLAGRILGIHGVLAKVMILCLVLHIAGALNHFLIRRDGVLRRMLPGR